MHFPIKIGLFLSIVILDLVIPTIRDPNIMFWSRYSGVLKHLSNCSLEYHQSRRSRINMVLSKTISNNSVMRLLWANHFAIIGIFLHNRDSNFVICGLHIKKYLRSMLIDCWSLYRCMNFVWWNDEYLSLLKCKDHAMFPAPISHLTIFHTSYLTETTYFSRQLAWTQLNSFWGLFFNMPQN